MNYIQSYCIYKDIELFEVLFKDTLFVIKVTLIMYYFTQNVLKI